MVSKQGLEAVVYNEQDLLPIEQIKNELLLLCADGLSGDFWLFTEEKHVAVISLHEGDIVGLRYRISRGNNALKLIKSISKAKIRFQPGAAKIDHASTAKIPSTAEILHILGIELNCSALQETARTVLVVEDSTTQRKIICKMLNQNGYCSVEASDGYEAIAQVNKTKPDLILLDIIMPGIDGYKVMSAIKEKPGMENVPILMLTSRDSLIDKVRGRVSGTDEYLTKPFKSEELIEKVDKYLLTDDENILRAAHSKIITLVSAQAEQR